MRRTSVALHFLMMALLLASPSLAETAKIQATTLVIQGMTPGAGEKVRQELETVPGVSMAKVSESQGVAVVVYDPAKTQADQLTHAVEAAGYLAVFAKANFRCPTCGATYADAGECIVEGAKLESIA